MDKENEQLKFKESKNKAMLRQQTIITAAAVIILLLISAVCMILFWSNQQTKDYNQELKKQVKKIVKQTLNMKK